MFIVRCRTESQEAWKPDRSDIVNILLEVLFALEDKHGPFNALLMIIGLLERRD